MQKYFIFILSAFGTVGFSDFVRTNKSFLIVPSQSPYEKDEITKKICEYKWSRKKVLLFLVLHKLHNIEINSGFNFRYQKYEYTDKSGLSEFIKESETAINSLKRITELAIRYNIWDYRSSPAFSVVKEIEESLDKYIENDRMRTLINNYKTDREPGCYEEEVFELLSSRSYDSWKYLEYDLLLSESIKSIWLLKRVFYLSYFFEDLFAYKNVLFIFYSELRSFLPSVSIYNIICIDWSKYLLDTSLGFAYKYYRATNTNSDLVKEWENYAKKDLSVFFKELFDISHDLYYALENTHPLHFTQCDDSMTVTDLSELNLQTYFIKLCGVQMHECMNIYSREIDQSRLYAIQPFYLQSLSPKNKKETIKLVMKIISEKCNDKTLVKSFPVNYTGYIKIYEARIKME